MTVRGEVADVEVVQPERLAELPFRLADPVHVAAFVTDQLTAKGVPTVAALGAVNAKFAGEGAGITETPHPAGSNVTPVARRSVLPSTSEMPLASVVMVQFVDGLPLTGAVVIWTRTCARAIGAATIKTVPAATPR